MNNDATIFAGLIAAIFGLVALLTFGTAWTVNYFQAPYESRQCARYGDVTGREVQFRQFSHWSYDCFVRLENGVWVSKSQVRGVNE